MTDYHSPSNQPMEDSEVKKSFLVTMVIALALSGISLILAKPESARGQEPQTNGVKQIIEIDELMSLLIDPIYEDLKDAIEAPPEGRKAWRSLYISSHTLAESQNLLFSREDDEYTTESDWDTFSAEARDISAMFAASVKQRETYATLKTNFLNVVQSCNACHERFSSNDPPVIAPPTSWAAAAE